MGRVAAALLLVLTCAVPALAAELPARKAGLWDMKTTTAEGHVIPVQQCIDARTDQAMQSSVGTMAPRDCSKHDIQKSGDTMTVNSVCTVAGKTRTSHMVITGSFDSGYTMAITTGVQGAPAARAITITAKWLGPCAAGQKPGDMIMPDGKTINFLDLQKAAIQRGAPGAPPPR